MTNTTHQRTDLLGYMHKAEEVITIGAMAGTISSIDLSHFFQIGKEPLLASIKQVIERNSQHSDVTEHFKAITDETGAISEYHLSLPAFERWYKSIGCCTDIEVYAGIRLALMNAGMIWYRGYRALEISPNNSAIIEQVMHLIGMVMELSDKGENGEFIGHLSNVIAKQNKPFVSLSVAQLLRCLGSAKQAMRKAKRISRSAA